MSIHTIDLILKKPIARKNKRPKEEKLITDDGTYVSRFVCFGL